jgi:hypothetical protein
MQYYIAEVIQLAEHSKAPHDTPRPVVTKITGTYMLHDMLASFFSHVAPKGCRDIQDDQFHCIPKRHVQQSANRITHVGRDALGSVA